MKHFFLLFLVLTACSSKRAVKSKKETPTATLKTSAYQYGPTFKNEGNFFEDVSEKMGLSKIKAKRFYAIDFTHDGYADLVTLESNFATPRFYKYIPQAQKFMPHKNLFIQNIKASFLNFADIDGDNVIDAIAGVLNQKTELSQTPMRVFKGVMTTRGMHFDEVVGAIKEKPMPTATAIFLDYNHDGHLDIFLGNWFGNYKGKPLPIRDVLLKGKNFKFSRTSEVLKTEDDKTLEHYHNARPTYGVSTCDIDQNGFVDILTTSTSRYHNKLWMNLYTLKGDKREFQDFGVKSLYASDVEGRMDPRGGGRSFFSACQDYNEDTMMDIYVGELSHSYDTTAVDKSSVLTGAFEKLPPNFIRTEYMNDIQSLNWNQGDRRAIWFDYNFDGQVDLLVDNSGFPPTSRMVLFEQKPDKSFENIAHIAGIDIINPTGTIIIDFNKDGKLDLITAQTPLRNSKIKNRLYAFKNRVAYEGRRALKVYLNGKKANTMGLGAMVYLNLEKGVKYERRSRNIEYTQGALPSQNEEGVVFGIARDEKPLSIDVTWPTYPKLREKGRVAKQVSYDMSKKKFKYYLEITLCENGDILKGKKVCP
jgi:hypothetical protein